MKRLTLRLVVGTLIVVVGFAAAGAVLALFSSSGVGPAASKAQTMPTGNAPTLTNTPGTSSVGVSWAQSSFGVGGGVAGYVVTRYSTGNVAQATGAGCSGVVAALSCTETSVPDGAWHYTVTPVQGLWQGTASSSSGVVNVTSCTKQFINTGSNQSWQLATNWSPTGAPTTGDLVCIPALGGSVSYTGATSSVARVLAFEPVTINSGALTIAAGSLPSSFSTLVAAGGSTVFNTSVAIGALTQSGTIDGSAPVTVSGSWVWSGGFQQGASSTTVLPGAVFTLSGSGNVVGRTIVNQTVANFTSPSGYFLSSGAIFRNEGTLNLAGGNGGAFSNNGGTTSFLNVAGATLTRTAAASGVFTMNVPFDNDGTVNVNAVTLTIQSSGVDTDTGGYNVAAGALLNLTAPTRAISGPIASSGTVAFPSGTTTLTGAYASTTTLASGGTLVFNNGATTFATLTQSSGIVDGSAALSVSTAWTWSAGTQRGASTTTVLSGATFTLSGTGTIDGRTVVNQTLANYTSPSQYSLQTGATFRNEATLNLSGGNGGGFTSSGGTTAFKNVAGATLTRTAAGSGAFTMNVPFDNDGTVNANGATLVVQSSGIDTDAGGYNVASGATLTFTLGTRAISGTIASLGTVSFPAGTFTLTGAYASTTTLVSGAGAVVFNNGTTTFTTLTQSGGTIDGTATLSVSTAWTWSSGNVQGSSTMTVLSGATFTMSGSGLIVGRTVVNQTVANFTSPSLYSLQTGGTFRNEGTLNLSGGNGGGFTSSGGTTAFKNASGATLTRTAAASGLFTMNVPFDNDGAINVNGATFYLSGGFGNITSGKLSRGAYTVTGGATFRILSVNISSLDAPVTIDGAASAITDGTLDGLRNFTTITANGALTLLNGRVQSTTQPVASSGAIFVGTGGAKVTVAAGLTLSAGSLSGVGTVQAPVTNTGAAVSPGLTSGAVGTLTVTGAYAQSGTGKLTIDVVGPPGSVDLLAVSGAATVGGVLSLTTTGFTPAPATSFTVLTASSVGGTFGSVSTAGATSYTLLVGAADVSIVAV